MNILKENEPLIEEGANEEEKALAAGQLNQGFPDLYTVNGSRKSGGSQPDSTAQPNNVFAVVPPPEPATGIADMIHRYCVISNAEVDAMALWLIASYVIDDFRIFPKLALISPEKRCGKTTTMEVIHSMAKDGLLVSNLSPAVLYRITEQIQPTLFIDEADTFLKNGDAEVNGIINSSHTKSAANVTRCVGENHETHTFSTWMPMVLASIGDLADTLMDRSLVINLRRKKSHEQAEEVPADLQEQNEKLCQSIVTWLEVNRSVIKDQVAHLPKVGNDRAEDNWRPLFKVAAVLGESWANRCQKAYQALTIAAEPELPTMLLQYVRDYFRCSELDRVTSSDLRVYLCEDEEGPWKTCNNGKSVTANMVAKLLRPYGIKPKTIRVNDKTPRGYELSQFEDAFERYLS